MFENDDDLLYLSPLPQPKKPSSSDKVSFYAEKNGVEPEFVRAVMGQESSGNPTAKSWANAKGLLQLTDAVGRKYRKNDYDPYNEDINLDAGTQHLKYLLDKYKGDKKRVLAAYNAGEDNADKPDWYEKSVYWSNDKDVQAGLKPRGPSDKTNTRNYIDKIYGNYEKFRGNQPSSQIEDLSFLSPLANIGDETENLDSLSPLTSTPNDLPPGFQSEPDPEYMAQFSPKADFPQVPMGALDKFGNQATWNATPENPTTPTDFFTKNGETIPITPTTANIPPNVPMKQLLDKQGNLPEHIPTLDPKILKTGDGRTLIKHSDQSGLQPGEVRYRNSANDKGGVVILKTDGFGKFFESKPTANLAQNERPVTKQQNLPSSAKEPQFGVSVGVEDFQPIPPNQTDEQPKQQGQPLYEARNNQEILAKGSAKTVPVDLSAVPNGVNKQLYAGREALRQIAANYELTDAEIDSYLAENPNRLPKVTDKNGKEYNSVIDITVQNQVINEILNRRKGVFGNDVQSIEQPTSTNPFLNQLNKDKKAQNAYINPELQTDIQMKDAQYQVGNRDLSGIEEKDAEEQTKREIADAIINPQVSWQSVGDSAAKGIQQGIENLSSPFTLYKNVRDKLSELSDGLNGITPQTSEAKFQEVYNKQIDEIKKDFGSFKEYQRVQNYIKDMSPVELGVRTGANYFRSTINTAISSNLQGLDVIDKYIEKVNPIDYFMPESMRPNLRNLENGIGFTIATLLGKGDKFQRITPETDAKDRLFYTLGKRIKDELGEDKYLRSGLAKVASENLGNMTGFMLLGMIAPELSAGEFSITSAISGALGEAGSMYEQAKQKGYSENTSLLAGFVGTLTGATEGFGAGAALNKALNKAERKAFFGRVVDFAKETGKEILKDGAEEFSQETLQNVTEGAFFKYLEQKDSKLAEKVISTLAGLPNAEKFYALAGVAENVYNVIADLPSNIGKNAIENGVPAGFFGGLFGQATNLAMSQAEKAAGRQNNEKEYQTLFGTKTEITPEVKPLSDKLEVARNGINQVQSEIEGLKSYLAKEDISPQQKRIATTELNKRLGELEILQNREKILRQNLFEQTNQSQTSGGIIGQEFEQNGEKLKVISQINPQTYEIQTEDGQIFRADKDSLEGYLKENSPTTAPEPEAPETIAAQVESAQHPESPRIGVLYTDGEAEPKVPKGFIRAKVKEGILHINKEKAQEFGLDTSKKVQDFVKENGVSSLIGKVEEVKDTSKGIVVVTTDADTGLELSSSVVSSEENAQKQIEADKESFPGKNHEHQIMTVPEAVERRKMNRVALQPKAQNLADNATQNKPVSVNTATNNDSSLTDKKDDSLTGKIEHIANSILATISAKKDAERNLQDIDNHLAEIEQKIQNGENVAYPELLNQKTKGGAAFDNFTLSPDHHVLSKGFADNPLHTIQYLRSRIQQGIEKAQYRNSPEYKQEMTELEIQGIDQQLSDLDTATKTVTMFGKKIQEKLTPAEKEKRKNLLEKEKEKLINQLPKGDKTESATDAAHEAATSPLNDLPEPTQAQKEAGNYKMGHINVNGLDITVEIPTGGMRSGVNKKGKAWKRKMKSHYGYFKRTVGADTENIDVFVKDGTPQNFNGDVFIVDQVHPDTGDFDEHKVMLGFNNEEEARKAYLENYAKNWKGLKQIVPMSFDDFKQWTKSEPTAPAAEFAKLPENISETWDVKYLNPPTKTSTGRAVTSFPMVDASTRQKGKNTETRIDSWLIQNAIDEAKSRGDKFNLSTFAGQAGKKLTQADREAAFEYLFSEDWKNVGKNQIPNKEASNKNAQNLIENNSSYSDYNLPLAEFINKAKKDIGEYWENGFDAVAMEHHRKIVEQALKEGKAVSDEAIRPYQDLREKYQQTETADSAFAVPDVEKLQHGEIKTANDGTQYRILSMGKNWTVERKTPKDRVYKSLSVSGSQVAMSQYVADAIKQSEKPEIAQDNSDKTSYSGYVANLKTEADNLSQYAGKKIKFNRNGKEVEGTIGNAVNMPNGLYFQHIEDSEGKLLGAVFAKDVEFVEENPTIKEIADASPNVFIVKPGASEPTKTNELPYTAESLGIQPIEEDTWKYFDKKKFDSSGAKLFPLDKLISTKNESLDAKFIAGLKGHPVKNAAGAFQKGAKNDAAFRPRKPLYIADNGDGTYRVLDGNATTQAAKFVGWTQVPAIIADAAKVVELMRNESSFKDATTLAKFFLEGQKPRIQRELAEAAGLNGNASVEEILEATYGKPNAADQLTSEALAKFTDDFKKAEGNAEKQKEISAQLAANLKLAKKFGELEKTDEIVRLSFAVRQAAESEKDTYFSDVQKVAEQVGGEVDSKIRKFLTKTALSLAKKLSIKSNKVPSDLLRTTILIPEGSPAQSSQIAYQTIEAMGKLGYKVWADESGNPDFTNRFEDEAPGYKDINLKFIKGESDPVIKELQLIQPAMAAAKTEGHKDYDAVKDILDELKNNKSLSEEEQRDLTDEMVKLNEKMANAYKTAFDKDVQASAGSDILSSINLPSLTIPATEAGSSKEGLAKRNLSADSALVILSTYTSSSRLSSTERAAKFLDSKVDSDITVSPSTSIITKTKGNESTNQPTDYGAPPTNQNQPTPLDPLAKYSDDTVKDILRLGGLLTQDYKLTHIEEQTVTRLVNLIKEETRLNERSVYNLARQSVSKNNKPTIKNEGENDVSESTTNRGSQESGNSDNSVSSGNSTQLLGDKLPDVSEGVGNSGEVTSPNSSGPILSDVRVSDKRGDGTVSGETGSNGGNNLPTNRRSGSKLDNKSTESVVGTTGNYYVNDIQEFASGGLKTKFNQNVEALETLRDIQREGRQTATPEEQKKLAKYLGWGQFPALFNTYNQSGETWAKERETLLSLINKEEFEAASASTKNAHYTAPQIVRTVWDIVQKLGFKGGRVLETSLGTGNFLMMMPPELRGTSKVTGIELDQLTAQIAKLLFPTYDIRQQGYETFDPPKGYYDLAISNVPFGRYKIADLKMPNFLKSEIHNYFFAKSLQNVRPGGLIAFITSTGTMTSADVTNYLKGKADLVTAVRFPANTFLKEAGTAVVTDLVVLRVKDEQAVPRLEKELSELKDTETYLKERFAEMQKDAEAGTNIQFQQVLLHLAAVRQSIASINNELQKLKMFDQHNWSEIGTIPDPAGGDDIPLNRYYVDNPQNMLGKMDRSGTMYRGNSVNLSRTPDFEHLLDKYLHNLPQNVMLERNEKALITQKSIPAPVHLRQGALIVKDGKVYSREGSFLKDVPMGVKQIKVLEGLLKLRDVYNEVTDFERGGNIREADNARKILNETYDNFVKTHGTVRDNFSLMKTDPDVYRLLGLENFDKKTKKVTGKADIFFQPTVSISAPLTSADNYGDALNIVLNSSGFVDIARIADLMNVDQEQAGRDLVENGLAFHDPRDGWEVKDLYLSGEVRRKLREAKEAAKTDSIYEKNIEALEKVQPEDIPYRKIKPTLGAAWIPASDIKQFMADMFNENGENATPDDFLVEKIGTGDWVIGFDNSYLEDSRTSTEILGTERRAFDKIVTAAIKDMPIVLYNSKNDGGGIDKRGSLRANNKVRDIRRKFAKWVWADGARRERLHRAYNDTYNDTIETKWDGSHLTFPGMVTRWVNELRPHIKNAVYRLLVKGRMLAAHEVGTGKTSLMIASAMELRRLNLAKKPAIVCLNANVEQVAEAAREMYPNAKILAAYSGMDAHTRKETTTRIMSGDWDIVVLTHDNLQKVPMSKARQLAFINEELEYLRDQVRAAEAAEASQNTGYGRNKKSKNQDNRVVKALEAKIATRIAKYQELFAKPKDDVVTFEETGIDFLLVDEAHAFKNLSISTTREGTKGIPTSDAQRATNMFMLTRYLGDTHNNRGMAFFTGTPISNTTAEAFNVQRYLQYQDLKARGIEKFDAWAANYGENISTQEMSATGEYKYVTAFRQFKNLETLSGLLRQVMDVVWAADVGAIHRPNKIDHVISVPMSEAQRDFQQTLIERAEKLKSMSRQERKEKGADNWLAIGQHAKWAAIDMRLVDPEAEDDPNSKTNALVREVLEVHRNNPGKTQLIFSNIGVNPNKINPKFHLYGDIIKKLVEGGIPRNKIIDFTKFKSSKTLKDGEEDDGSSPQKEEAMRRLSSGEALVAIGSAEKLGTGVNVQEKVVAMHKLDVKQRPDQDEQETGRGWRHGNQNEQVHLYRYTTQDSFDMFFYDRLKQKQNFITSLIKGDVSGEFTDSLDESLDYDTIVALTASDPLIKERVDTMRQLSVLENEFEGFEEDQLRLRDALRKAQNRIKSNEREIADITEDKNAALEKENNRTVKLNDQTFNVESPEEIWDYKNKIAEIETQIREQILADEAKQKHPWTDKKPTEKLIEAKEQYDKELQKQFRAMVKAETDKLGVPEWKKVNKAFSQRLDAYRKQAKEDYWGFGQRLIRNGDEDFGEMFGFPLRVAFSEPWDKTTKEIIMQPYLVMPSGRQAELRTANDLVDKVDKELFNVRIKSTDGLRSEAEIAKSDIPRLEKQLENQFEQKDLLEELRTKLSRIELELGGDVLPEGYQLVEDRIRDLGETKTDEKTDVEYTELEQAAKGFEVGNTKTLGKYARKGQLIIRGENLPETEKKTDLWTDEKTENDIKNTISYFKSGKGKEIVPVAVDLEPDQVLFDNGKWLFARDFAFIHKAFPNAYYLTNNSALMAINNNQVVAVASLFDLRGGLPEDLMPAIRRARFAAEFAKEKRDKLTKLFTEPFRKAQEIKAQKAFGKLLMPSQFDESTFDYAKPEMLYKKRSDQDAAERDRLETVPTHELFDGFAKVDGENVELDLKAAENLRRHIAELSFFETGDETDESSFDGITLNDGSMKNLIELLQSTYDQALTPDFGYSKKELAGHKSLLDAMKTLAKNQKVGVLYVFDDALPEELFHKLDMLSGRTDETAEQIIMRSPIWKNAFVLQFGKTRSFKSEYGNQSTRNRISEVIAKLATGQETRYGLDNGFASREEFEAERDRLIQEWADGVLRKNPNLEKTLEDQIKNYATKESEVEKGDSANSNSNQQINRKESASQKSESDQSGESSAEETESESDRRLPGRSDEVKRRQQAISTPIKFESSGKTKTSQTPETLRENNIDVGDRVYVSTSNIARQTFADAILDEGAESAQQWLDKAVKDKENQSGATVAVAFNLMNHYGKTGDLKNLNKVADDIIPMITDAAQTVQAVSLVNMYNPELAGSYATKVKKQKTGQDITERELAKAQYLANQLQSATNNLVTSQLQNDILTKENETLKTQVADNEKTLSLINKRLLNTKLKMSEIKELYNKVKKQLERLQESRPPKQKLGVPYAKLVKELEDNKQGILDRLQKKFGNNVMLKMVNGNSEHSFLKMVAEPALIKIEQDEVDFVTLKLIDALKNSTTPSDFINDLDNSFNGKLTPFQLQQLHAEAVKRLQNSGQPLSDEQKALAKNNRQHRKIAKEFFNAEQIKADEIKNQFIKNYLKSLKDIKAKNPHLNLISKIVELAQGKDFESESVAVAVSKQEGNDVKTILHKLQEEFDLSEKDAKKVLMQGNALIHQAKQAIEIENKTKKFKIALNEKDLENFKAEQKMLNRQKRQVDFEMRRFYEALSKSTLDLAGDTITGVKRANLLSLPLAIFGKGVAKDFVSTGLFNVTDNLTDAMMIVGDALLSKAQGKDRTIAARLNLNAFKSVFMADETMQNLDKKSGLATAWGILRHGEDIDEAIKKDYIPTDTKALGERLFKEGTKRQRLAETAGGVVDWYIDKVFRTRGMYDAISKVYAFRKSLEQQASVIAKNENLSDEERRSLILNPTNVMQIEAMYYAEEMSFQDDNVVNDYWHSLQAKSKFGKFASNQIIPFAKTVSNVLYRTLQHTPLGFADAARLALVNKEKAKEKIENKYREAVTMDAAKTKNWEQMNKAEQLEYIDNELDKILNRQQKLAIGRAISRGSFGTAGLALGYFLAMAGIMAGALDFDDDKEESARRRKAGIENNSVNFANKFRFSLPETPFGTAMAIGATIADNQKLNTKKRYSTVNPFIDAVGESFYEQAKSLPQVRGTLDFLDNQTFPSRAGTFFAPYLTPSWLSEWANIDDTKDRTGKSFYPSFGVDKFERKRSKLGEFGKPFAQRLPGLRQKNAEIKNQVNETERGGFWRKLIRANDPLNVRSAN